MPYSSHACQTNSEEQTAMELPPSSPPHLLPAAALAPARALGTSDGPRPVAALSSQRSKKKARQPQKMPSATLNENNVLKPIGDLNLPNKARVSITIHESFSDLLDELGEPVAGEDIDTVLKEMRTKRYYD